MIIYYTSALETVPCYFLLMTPLRCNYVSGDMKKEPLSYKEKFNDLHASEIL